MPEEGVDRAIEIDKLRMYLDDEVIRVYVEGRTAPDRLGLRRKHDLQLYRYFNGPLMGPLMCFYEEAGGYKQIVKGVDDNNQDSVLVKLNNQCTWRMRSTHKTLELLKRTITDEVSGQVALGFPNIMVGSGGSLNAPVRV